MMNRLRCPWAQICQRARAKPSQPRKAMIPGTSGRFNLDHSDGGLCRRDLSSSDVDVSCNRKPPPWLSQREGEILGQARAAYQSDPLRCDRLRRIPFTRENDTEPKDVVAAVPKSGTPETSSALPVAAGAEAGARPDAQPDTERAPDRRPAARRLLAAAAVALAVALLFLAYLRMSRTYPENSDESNDLLMAWDMLHGNVLLHGWYLSDVSFITTELPQYVLLERLFGLHADTAHIAAAMTYTLVVLLAVLLARGRVSRREAGPRMLLTAGLMFAPQLGVGVFVLLLSLGHIAVVVGLLLTWLLVADPIVLLVGVAPLVAVCAMRVARGLSLAQRADGREPGWGRDSLRAHSYELSLAVAAILAQGLAS